MAIKLIKFQNFKVFRKATLPLGHTTLIVGPNGSGKTTALRAIKYLTIAATRGHLPRIDALRSVGASEKEKTILEVEWDNGSPSTSIVWPTDGAMFSTAGDIARLRPLQTARVFSFQHDPIAASVQLVPVPELNESGHGLPGVLTAFQDHHPERFESLNKDLSNWLPEFDRVLLDTPAPGQRAFSLRTRSGSHRIPASDLSQGTLFALTLLALSHMPNPPSIVALEDPDRGMHPRLLRDILDATERLANPQAFGDSRPAVQVVMTTHSPFLVDLFRGRPEDVVLIAKTELTSEFQPLSQIPNIDEILSGAHLGDAWFSGSLGGVPAHT